MLFVILMLVGLLALFPIGDDNSGRRTTPYVTYALMAMNIVVYFLLQGGGMNDAFTYGYSVIPQEILRGKDYTMPVTTEIGRIPQAPGPNPIYLTLLSAMFMHGSLMHLFGNMLYLWIFGDNIEDAMGHVKFLVFYVLCGLLASGAHILFDQNSFIPSLGASGAIAGVLGGYILLYPTRSVRVLIGLLGIVQMPALIVIGIWAVLQFISGFGAIARTQVSGGGVAYMAHVGGFIAGFLLVSVFRNPQRQRIHAERVHYPSDIWDRRRF
jgi:membrane associated rhomboid family serine protease